jgi:hypothetical protein
MAVTGEDVKVVDEIPTPPVPTEVEVQASSPEPVWASPSSLPSELWHDTYLPVLEQWARIRFLTNPEAAQLAFLPDLANFTTIMAKAFRKANAGNQEDVEAVTPEEEQTYQVERVRYIVRVAHLCVMERGTPMSTEVCDDPGCGMGRHIPSVWTVAQCEMLDYADLELVASVAERSADLAALRPFSPGETQSSTPPPVSTGT